MNTNPETKEKEIDPILEDLKKKYTGRITTLKVPLSFEEDEDDENKKYATFYLKSPDKQARQIVSKLSQGASPERAIIAGLHSMRLGGDEVSLIENNYDALISLEGAMIKHLEVQKTIIKKN